MMFTCSLTTYLNTLEHRARGVRARASPRSEMALRSPAVGAPILVREILVVLLGPVLAAAAPPQNVSLPGKWDEDEGPRQTYGFLAAAEEGAVVANHGRERRCPERVAERCFDSSHGHSSEIDVANDERSFQRSGRRCNVDQETSKTTDFYQRVWR